MQDALEGPRRRGLTLALDDAGLERPEELAECVRMGVPLGQGYLLGRPGPPWQTGVDLDLANLVLREAQARRFADTIARVLTPAAPVRTLDEARSALSGEEGHEVIVLIDQLRRPVGLLGATDVLLDDPVPRRALRVKADDELVDVARRMTVRDAATRFDPAVCCDGRGALVGLVRAERVLRALAMRASGRGEPEKHDLPADLFLR